MFDRISIAKRIVACVLFVVVAHTAGAAEGTVHIRFDATSVIATGATPGKSVQFFAITNDSQEYSTDIRRVSEVIQAGDDGTARLDVAYGVGLRALWFAIDVHSGEYAVASPGGFPLRRVAATPDAMESKHPTRGDVLAVPFAEAEILVVRDGGGSWAARATKGSRQDLDAKRTGRRMLIAPASLKKSHGEGPPALDGLQNKDILVVVDPYTLVFFVGSITREAK